MVAAAVIGGVATLGGAAVSASAAGKAGKAAAKGAAQAAAIEKYQYDTTRSDYAPYRQVGYDALDALAGISGLPSDKTYGDYVRANPDILKEYNSKVDKKLYPSVADYGRYHYQTYGQGENRKLPTSTADPFAGFKASPGYLFRLQEGRKAIERSAAARGGLYSGATMKAIDANAQGVASDEFGNYTARLMALAGVGQAATGTTAAAGQSYASGASQAAQQAGNARASSYQAQGNIWGGAIGSLGQLGAYAAGTGALGGGGGNNPYGGTLGGIY